MAFSKGPWLAMKKAIWISIGVLVLVIVIAAAWGAIRVPEIAGLEQIWAQIVALWNRQLIGIGSLSISLALIFRATIFVLALSIAAHYARKLLRIQLDRSQMDIGQKYALEMTAGYVVFGLGLFVGLESIGLNLSSLTVLGGAIGIGIGFGLQSIMNNFVSGLILLFERPIKVGDRIEVEELNGDVVRIGARSTWVRTNDNIMVVLPNSDFITNSVVNWTANDRRVRFSVPLGVSYSSNPEQVRDILLAIAKRNPDVLQTPPPDVVFKGFGDSSLDFDLRVWTSSKLHIPQVLRSDLYFEIFKAFRENKVEIPFPQRDLHLRTVHVPWPPAQAANGKESDGARSERPQ